MYFKTRPQGAYAIQIPHCKHTQDEALSTTDTTWDAKDPLQGVWVAVSSLGLSGWQRWASVEVAVVGLGLSRWQWWVCVCQGGSVGSRSVWVERWVSVGVAVVGLSGSIGSGSGWLCQVCV